MANAEEKIKEIIAEQLGVNKEEVKPESSFVDDLGADSLDTVEIVMALEEEFGIEIPDEDAEKMSTVKEAVGYIEDKVKQKESQSSFTTMDERRVVVTGLGIVSPVGTNSKTWLLVCACYYSLFKERWLRQFLLNDTPRLYFR